MAHIMDQEDQRIGLGTLSYNDTDGNHVVASRDIKAGEMILEESEPLVISSYGPLWNLPYCLTCGIDISFSARCSICKWPLCCEDCEKDELHSRNECPILLKAGIKFKGLQEEYNAIETIRCCLLKLRDPAKWLRILRCASHDDERKHEEMLNVKNAEKYIRDFVLETCGFSKLGFDEYTVSKVIGILAINTFCSIRFCNRYISALFDKATYFNHDCDPNTERYIKLWNPTDKGKPIFSNQILAKRFIFAGDEITISYIDVLDTVRQRRAQLKQIFYFDCCCSKCLLDLMQEDSGIEV